MTAYASDDRITTVGHAGVAELADALDLGSSAYGVGVRLPSPAPINFISTVGCYFFSLFIGPCGSHLSPPINVVTLVGPF